ncbi:MAG: nucleotidyltransferase domain-containing protein [Gammaproteobacteria bacterium]|nr:nucleotidyltransferase domain-containing protein [Gammaproteobacteria bacterium]
MRLTQEERSHIKHHVSSIFGAQSRVFLFGSRVDDAKKGGDIDLFIEPECIFNPVEQEIQLLTKLQFVLGDQKIDIVIARDPNRLIEQEARRNGELL